MPDSIEKPVEPFIIAVIRDEHKYSRILMSVLNEQLNEYSIGKKADYTVMLELVNYMEEYPQKFNHPVKQKLISQLIKKEPDNIDFITLLAEKNHAQSLAKEVITALKALIKEETIIKEEKLKIFSKDYIELIESHIAMEEDQLIPKALSIFTQGEFERLEAQYGERDEQDFSAVLEMRYQALNADLQKHWDKLEGAASNLAMAEFLSLSALFDAIGPIAIGTGEISTLVKDYSYKMLVANYDCYKELLSQRQTNKDRYLKPVACMKDCYVEYQSGVTEISNVMKKTRLEIMAPYQFRKTMCEDEKSMHDA